MDNINPLVSIIIPLYNSELYITETINSVLNQTYSNIETIIIDDGSTDNSYQIAKNFESEYVKIFRQENKGASAARNIGLKEAKGDFIQFLDADDLISPQKIEKQLQLITSNKDSISYCETIIIKDGVTNHDNKIQMDFKNIFDPFELLLYVYGGYGNPSMIAVHSWLTPHHIIKNVGGWNENLSMDDDGEFFCRVVLASKKVIFCDGVYSYYRKGNNLSLSSQKDLKHYQSELNSVNLKCSYLLAANNCFEARKAMAFWFMRIAILSYPKFKEISSSALLKINHLNVKPAIPVIGGVIAEIIKKIFGWKAVRILQSLKNNDKLNKKD